jgi:hypothetical protein
VITAWVDTILEMRRYNPDDRADRRRLLTAYGRWDETADLGEQVVELHEGGTYTACGGDRDVMRSRDIISTLTQLLPTEQPGLTPDQILELWPEDEKPRRSRFFAALSYGLDDGLWFREGRGVRGDPHTYWIRSAQVFTGEDET